jgi:NADPH:quinone reductase-like Zn-dependent oxidoreductase
VRKLEIEEFGAPEEVVRLVQGATPAPGPSDLVVAMEAAPVNPSDLLLVRGYYGHRPELPAVLGTEGVGRVIAVGAEVDPARVGERVMILPALRCATWQDLAVVADADAITVDRDADPLQLAMLGINPLTADLLLRRFVDLPPGSWVAQTAGNSAIGTCIALLAARRGLRTLSVVRRPDAVAEVRASAGDAVVVQGRTLTAQLKEALGRDRISLLLDGSAGDVVADLAPWLVHGGTVVSYGGMSGEPLTIRPADLIFRDLRVRGFWQKHWLDTTPAAEIAEGYARVAPLVASGALQAPVAATYPLAEHRAALTHAAASGRSGKILFAWPSLI